MRSSLALQPWRPAGRSRSQLLKAGWRRRPDPDHGTPGTAKTAVALLLEHPTIRPETMSGLIEGREIKRSNKDLGRVLAIARLSSEEAILSWPAAWEKGLRACFPSRWRALARSTGSGLRRLLDSPPDLGEAHHTCVYGLLRSRPATVEELGISGRRLLQDAVEPVEGIGRE